MGISEIELLRILQILAPFEGVEVKFFSPVVLWNPFFFKSEKLKFYSLNLKEKNLGFHLNPGLSYFKARENPHLSQNF